LAIGRAFAWLWYYVIPIRRHVAIMNVTRALGTELTPRERRRTVRRAFEHLVMMGVESLRMPGLTREKAAALVATEGMEHWNAAMARGKGVIGVMAHLGNFEMIGVSQGLAGVPLHGVVKDLKNPAVHKFIFDYRHRANFHTIPPKGSKEIIRATLLRGEAVGFVVDQHMAKHRAVVCSFFGLLASTSPAPARFSLETGAPIVPVLITRDAKRAGHHHLRVEPEFVLESPYADPAKNLWHNTERLNRILEGWIRKNPEQYLWLHKRFKVQDDPSDWDIPPELEHLRTPKASAPRQV